MSEEASTADPAAPSRPWSGDAQRADRLIVAGIVVSIVYGLATAPLTPALLAHHPVLLDLLTGSTSGIVTVGALARVGQASLVVGALAAVPGCIMFDWVYWWAGRRWGHRALALFIGRRALRPGAARRFARLEGFAARYSWLAVLFSWYLPVPSTLVYAYAGLGGMRLRTFLALDVAAALLWIGLLLGLGWSLGQRAVDLVHTVSHYALLATGGIVVVVIVVVLLRVRSMRASMRGVA